MLRNRRSAVIALCAALFTINYAPAYADPTPTPSPSIDSFKAAQEQYKIDRDAYMNALRDREIKMRAINSTFKFTVDKSTSDATETTDSLNADIAVELAAFQDQIKVVTSQISFLRQAVAVYNWAGLDASGTPVGFSSNLGSRVTAGAQLIKFPNLSNESSSSIFKVSQNGVELLLSQDLFYVDGKLTATILPLFAPANTPAVITSSEQSVTTGSDGSRLIISSLKLANTGSDGQSPSAINVRIKVSADGLEILAQSAQILFSGSTQQEGVI